MGLKRRNADGTTATSGQAEKYKKYRDQFEDPPNADTLMDYRLRTASHDAEMAEAAVLAQGDEGDTEEEAVGEGDNNNSGTDTEVEETQGGKRFCGLTYKKKGVNQKNVFIAVCYLNGRIPELLHGDTMDFSPSKNGRCFKKLAKELSESEPILRRVTGAALQTMYMRIVTASAELAAILETETGGRWVPTLLSDMADELRSLHEQFGEMKSTDARQKVDQRQLLAVEASANNEDATGASMMTTSKYKTYRKSKEQQPQQPGNPVEPLDSFTPVQSPSIARAVSVSIEPTPTSSAPRVSNNVVRPCPSSIVAPCQQTSPVLARQNSATMSNYSSTSASGFGDTSFHLTHHQLDNNYSELQRVVLTTVEKLRQQVDSLDSNMKSQGVNIGRSMETLHQHLSVLENSFAHMDEIVGGLQRDIRATASGLDTIQGTVKLLRTDFSGFTTHLADLREDITSQKRRFDDVLNDIDNMKRSRPSTYGHPPRVPIVNNTPGYYVFGNTNSQSSTFAHYGGSGNSKGNPPSTVTAHNNTNTHNNNKDTDAGRKWHIITTDNFQK